MEKTPEQQAQWANYLSLVANCSKCAAVAESKEAVKLFSKNTKGRVPYAWTHSITTQNSKFVSLCKRCVEANEFFWTGKDKAAATELKIGASKYRPLNDGEDPKDWFALELAKFLGHTRKAVLGAEISTDDLFSLYKTMWENYAKNA